MTQLTKDLGRAKGKEVMRERAESFQRYCGASSKRHFVLGGGIDLRAKSGVGVLYEDSTIAHKLYEPGTMPAAEDLLKDVESILAAYDDYIAAKATSGRVWLFQANPKMYDLHASLNVLSEQSWLVRQHKDDIRAGDKVYLWEAGAAGGIRAVATVTTDPAETVADPKEAEFSLTPEEFEGSRLRVRLRVDHRVDPPLGRAAQ